MTDPACNECGKDLPTGVKRHRLNDGYLCGNCWKRVVWRPRNGEAQARERARSLAWKEAHRGECEDCGKAIRYDSRYCPPCGQKVTGQMAAARQKAQYEARRQRIVTLWNEGWTMSQIAADLGCATNAMRPTMVKLRKQGYDLPYRRTPEQRARIKAGARKAAA